MASHMLKLCWKKSAWPNLTADSDHNYQFMVDRHQLGILLTDENIKIIPFFRKFSIVLLSCECATSLEIKFEG